MRKKANRAIKPYAVNIVNEIRADIHKVNRANLPAIDLAEVIAIDPIVIEPHGHEVEYEEEDLVFQIDPETVKVGDLLVLGRDSSQQPIVMGIADGNNSDPFDDPDAKALQDTFVELEANTKTFKAPVDDVLDLPDDPSYNQDNDLKYVKSENSLYSWDAGTGTWTSTSITPTKTVTTSYTALVTDDVILVDSTTGPITVYLPADHSNGKVYRIKDKMGTALTNAIDIQTVDLDTIDGAASLTFSANFQAVTVVSDGLNWYKL